MAALRAPTYSVSRVNLPQKGRLALPTSAIVRSYRQPPIGITMSVFKHKLVYKGKLVYKSKPDKKRKGQHDNNDREPLSFDKYKRIENQLRSPGLLIVAIVLIICIAIFAILFS